MDANVYQNQIDRVTYVAEAAFWQAFEDEYPYLRDQSLRELPGAKDFKKSIAEFVEYIFDQIADEFEVTLVKKVTFTFNMKALNGDDILEYIGDMRDPSDLGLEYSLYEEDEEWEVERVRQL